MRKIFIAGLIAVVVIVAAVMLAGCVEKNQVDVEQVRHYADPITENILLAMNEDNYAKYSAHFDQTQ
jgi:glucose uptake protein GlcU